MRDSPRWCETCKAYGDHHTDRHAPTMDEVLAVFEKSIKVKVSEPPKRRRFWGRGPGR